MTYRDAINYKLSYYSKLYKPLWKINLKPQLKRWYFCKNCKLSKHMNKLITK